MKKKKILIVVSRYNKLITKGLEKTAIDHLSQHRGFEKYLTEAPGAICYRCFNQLIDQTKKTRRKWHHYMF